MFAVPAWLHRIRGKQSVVMAVAGIAVFTDMLIFGLAIPVLPKLLETMVDNVSTANGILSGSFAVGLLVGAPISGRLSDKYCNRQIPMCVGLVALLVSTLLFGIGKAYWQLILARIVQGAASGASWSVGFSMVADVYPPEKAGVVMGTVMGCNTLGHLMGPTIGGLLYEAGNQHTPFIFGACLAFVDLVARLVVGETYYWKEIYAQDDPVDLAVESQLTPDGELKSETSVEGRMTLDGEAQSTTATTTDVLDPDIEVQAKASRRSGGVELTIWEMLKSWRVVAVCIVSFDIALIMSGLDPILPLYLASEFDLSPGIIGLVFMAIVLPNAFMSPLVGWLIDRYQPNRIIICCAGLVLTSALCPLITLPKILGVTIFTLSLTGAVLSIALSPVNPELLYFMHEKGSNSFGVMYALFNIAFSIGMFIGPVMTGPMYERIGFLNTMLCIMGISLAVFVVLLGVELVKIHNRRRRSTIPLGEEVDGEVVSNAPVDEVIAADKEMA
ncbi:hypothetical protein IWQ60_004135 [Tieghemiomyces parasiticus]|uniref:Major facilitator superfamily (MFS) profile domain-containing protein n=1 Tax=Tieghemiomyces parasiticus TaxID=78921 RepID=A0A9W8A9G0_9FUNG|nr:hypothetical protein IWQ60_004135 [Tieghemiomyces parasiticus]